MDDAEKENREKGKNMGQDDGGCFFFFGFLFLFTFFSSSSLNWDRRSRRRHRGMRIQIGGVVARTTGRPVIYERRYRHGVWWDVLIFSRLF